MPIPVNLYVPQLAIVGNARLRGRDVRALVIDDPGAGAMVQSPDITDSEAGFRARLAARREASLKARRKDYKQGHGRPYTKELRPWVLELADKAERVHDFVRVMEEAGLSWRTQRLALATEGLHPLNMHHERTSEDMLPDYVRHPGYLAVGSRLARSAAAARNAALNASE